MSQENFYPDNITKYTNVFEFENFLKKSALSAAVKTMLKIRISQINKCHFCENLHTQELRSLGESECRIISINEWQAQSEFSEIEKTIFKIAEELSAYNFKLSKDTLAIASKVLDQVSMGQIITIALVTNFWNKFFTGAIDIKNIS